MRVIKNQFFALLLIFALSMIIFPFSEISYAEDESVSETHEVETEGSSVEHTLEEHSTHEGEESVHEAAEEMKHEHMGEVTEEESHVHSSITAKIAHWVGLGTLLVAAPVFGIKIRLANKIAYNIVYKNVVLTLAVGVGIMHILLAPDHLIDVSKEHGIFFALLGSAQIVFGLLFVAKPRIRLAMLGVAGTIGSIVLYFVTKIGDLPEPFGSPVGIDAVGIIAKIIEISLVALLLYLIVYLKRENSTEITKRI